MILDGSWTVEVGWGRIAYFMELQRLLGTYFENHLRIPLDRLNASKTI